MMVGIALNVASSIAQRIGIFQRQVAGHARRVILRASIRIGGPKMMISSTRVRGGCKCLPAVPGVPVAVLGV